MGSDRIADLRARANQKGSRAVKNKNPQAGFALDGDKPHGGTRDGYINSVRVRSIRLPTLEGGIGRTSCPIS